MSLDDRLQFLHYFLYEAFVKQLRNPTDSFHVDAQVNDVVDSFEFGNRMDETSKFSVAINCVEQKLGKTFLARQRIQSLPA